MVLQDLSIEVKHPGKTDIKTVSFRNHLTPLPPQGSRGLRIVQDRMGLGHEAVAIKKFVEQTVLLMMDDFPNRRCVRGEDGRPAS